MPSDLSHSYINGLFYKWKIPKYNLSEISYLAIDLQVNHTVASLLYARGYKTAKLAHQFLFPIHDNDIYHPKELLNSTKAVLRIKEAIQKKEKILIAGDYDVDGITSTSLMVMGIRELGGDVNFFLPHRVHDGYGLSVKTIEKAKNSGFTLVITVDNGISAYDALKKASELNLDVIVTDHHQPPNPLPTGAFCIVNPHLKNCTYPFKELAGVGVAFKIISYIFEIYGKELTSKMYELFLLGTVADVVPLIDENRYLVAKILHLINQSSSFALNVLKDNAKFDHQKLLQAVDIGFSLAPQLNALGRLEDPRKGVLFFLEDREEIICNIGKYLLDLNTSRKNIERKIIDEIEKDLSLKKEKIKTSYCLVLTNKNWPLGIVGLIASRLVNLYGMPTAILHETEESLLKGSLRSIPECDLFLCLKGIPNEILINFGGHKGAAGITLKKENLDKFIYYFEEEVKKQCTKEDLEPKIIVDSILNAEEISDKLWTDLSLLEPFGASNATPIFLISNIILTEDPQIIKELHTKIKINGKYKSIPIVFFNRPDIYSKLIEKSKEHNKIIHIIGKLTQNSWNNKKNIEMIGIDLSIS